MVIVLMWWLVVVTVYSVVSLKPIVVELMVAALVAAPDVRILVERLGLAAGRGYYNRWIILDE